MVLEQTTYSRLKEFVVTTNIDYAGAAMRVAMGFPPVDTACPAGVAGNTARCRNLIGSCPQHPDGKPPAPLPDSVLVRATLSRPWYESLRKAGVPLEKRPQKRREELGRKRIQQANRLGRKATFKDDPHVAGTPEANHSGTSVFGIKHLAGVLVMRVLNELSAGYTLSRASLVIRQNAPPRRGEYYTLQLVWSDEAETLSLSKEVRAKIDEFFSVPFGVLVWANPMKDEKVSHTVNCGYRGTHKPQLDLHFAGGDWGVKLLAIDS